MTRREGDPNFPTNLDIAPSTPAALVLGRPLGTGETPKDDASQDIEGFGIAGRTWEAAYLLRAYLTPPPPTASPSSFLFDPPCPLFQPDESGSLSRRRTILELGSGTGYLSLSLAPHLDSTDTLVATDLDNVCPLLEKNLAAAQTRWRSQDSPAKIDQARVLVRPLPWGDSNALARLADEGLAPSIILASDLVYFQFLYGPLLRTLIGLTARKNERVTVIFSYKVRSLVKEQPFWEAFGRWFDFEAVQVGTRPSPPPSEPDSPSQSGPPGSTLASPSSSPLVWTRFGAATPSSTTPNDTDELYVFICHRHPQTEHLGAEDLEDVSDEELLQGRGKGRGVDEGAERFEDMLMNGLEWD